MDKPSAAAVRTFPTAQEDAEKEVVSPNARYEGPESAYRLAFTDVDFLLRAELRPNRRQPQLLKPGSLDIEPRHIPAHAKAFARTAKQNNADAARLAHAPHRACKLLRTPEINCV